jgi:hypothetical protein
MSETTPRRRFQRAEAGARSLVILTGGGVMAFFLGGLLASGLAVRVAERVGTISDPRWGFLFGWFLQRIWLWVALPAIGWVVGRFLPRVKPIDFAVTASLTGEVFGMLLSSGVNGVDFLFVGVTDTVARILTFLLGLWFTKLATDAGRAANATTKASPAALSGQQRADYEAFAAKAEQEKNQLKP